MAEMRADLKQDIARLESRVQRVEEQRGLVSP